MKTLETTEKAVVDPKLEAELRGLLVARAQNTDKIASVILRMIKSREGGMNQKNIAIVSIYLRSRLHFSQEIIERYIDIAQGDLLSEVFNIPTPAGRLAWDWPILIQQAVVTTGLLVVEQLDAPPKRKKLHEMTVQEATRAVDKTAGKVRSAKEQRAFTVSVPPGKRDQLLTFWPNGWVRIAKRVPLADLEYLVKRMKEAGVRSVSDPDLRSKIDQELAQ